MPLVTATLIAGAKLVKWTPVVIAAVTPAATTMMIKAPEIIEFAKNIKTIHDGLQAKRDILNQIQRNFSTNNDWAGEDYAIHAQRHALLCEDIRQLEECLDSCHRYLLESAEAYEQAQKAATQEASTLTSPRGRQ